MHVLIITILSLSANTVLAANIEKCRPYCQRLPLEKLKTIDLSGQLPPRPSYYKFRVKGSHQGEKYFEAKLPIYKKTGPHSYAMSEEIEIGKDIELERLTNIRGRMYYRVTIRKDPDGTEVKGWIDGRFVEGYAYNESAGKE